MDSLTVLTHHIVQTSNLRIQSKLMSFLFSLLLILYCNFDPSYSQEHNDTLLSCFICMDLEAAKVKQKCDDYRPMFQTCVFTKDLINWKDVNEKRDSQVTFQCLLLYYKDSSQKEVQSLRGCVAEYKDYYACEHLQKLLKYKEEISCILCDTSNCNAGLSDNNSSDIHCNILMMIFLMYILFKVS